MQNDENIDDKDDDKITYGAHTRIINEIFTVVV